MRALRPLLPADLAVRCDVSSFATVGLPPITNGTWRYVYLVSVHCATTHRAKRVIWQSYELGPHAGSTVITMVVDMCCQPIQWRPRLISVLQCARHARVAAAACRVIEEARPQRRQTDRQTE